MKIQNIFARQILDSRGNPTVEVDVLLENRQKATASVPSGASTGEREACELRDGGKDFCGKGVLKAVNNINKKIAKKIVGMNVFEQEKIDKTMIDMDGTENKSNLGANAILGVSMAVARAASLAKGVELFEYLGGEKKSLPLPMLNILNGGKHASSNLNCQEYMVVPLSAKTFAKALQMGTEVFYALKNLLKERNLSTAVGDEGGFAPMLENDEEGLKIVCQAIEKAGYKAGKDVAIALDVAGSEMLKEGQKIGKKDSYYFWKTGEIFSSEQLVEYYENLVKKYPIISIEDGLSENDWSGWKILTEKLGKKIALVGDDLFVTNPQIFQKGIDEKIANSILIKPNQIGTVTQTLQTIHIAKQNGYDTVISHRSGETVDTFIADLVVAVSGGKIKTGAPNRGERVCKYNRLLQIEEIIAKK